MESMKQELTQSLDLVRSKTIAVKIKIRSEVNKMNGTKISMGLIMAGFGTSIYVLLPLSLLSFNIELMMGIFLWILTGMIAGFTLLSFNVQHIFE